MRVTLIHNPEAGDDDAPDGEALVRLIRRAGHSVLYQSARESHWTAALEAPADLVVAAGGDGTVGRVARRMIGRDVPMAAISLGTANNIARSLGLANLPIGAQVGAWCDAQPVALDAGRATGVWGRRFFIEGLGLGLFASLAAEGAGLSVKSAVATLRKHLPYTRARPIRAVLDGADISGDYLLFEVMNMPLVGPNLFLAPAARPDDGRLDVVMVRREDRDVLADYLAAWEAGVLAAPTLPVFQGRSLSIGPGRHIVHVDDRLAPLDRKEPEPSQPGIEVDVVIGALRFLLPEPAGASAAWRSMSVEREAVR
jgi:diacylglycerol kinase family enzyme